MNSRTAAAMLGCQANTLFKLAWLGVVAIRAGGGHIHDRWQVHVPQGATRPALYEDWVSRVRRWNYRTAVMHKDVRAICDLPDGHPQPAGIWPFVVRAVGGASNTPREELNAFFKFEGDRGDALLDEYRRQASIERRLGRRGLPGRPADLARRFPALARLAGTCLDPDEDDPVEPEPDDVGRVLALGPAAGPAALFLLTSCTSYRRPRSLKPYLNAFRELDMKLLERGAADTSDPVAVTDAFDALLEEARGDRPGARGKTQSCRNLVTAGEYLDLYARRTERSGGASLQDLLIAHHEDADGFRSRLRKIESGHSVRGGNRRKAVSDPLADQIEQLCRAARLRHEQVAATAASARKGVERLRERLVTYDALDDAARAGTPAFEEFIAETTVLDAKGHLRHGGAQECTWWAWRERDFWMSLEQGALRRQRGQSARRRTGNASVRDRALVDSALTAKLKDVRANPAAYDRIIYEYRGCRPTAGEVSIEPWFVTMGRHGVNVAPALMPSRQQRKRHRMMASWRLPPEPWLPSGLLSASKAFGTAWRWANDRHRTLIALDEATVSYDFAVMGFDVIVDTLCRIGECLQIAQDPEGWKPDDSVVPARMGFLAVPKGSANAPMPAPVAFHVSDDMFEDLMELAERRAKAAGRADGWLPALPPACSNRHRCKTPRPWIFQQSGRSLESGQLGYLIAMLLAGFGHVIPHALRHAAANRLRQLGVPERLVQILLNHRSRKTTGWYSRNTPKQDRWERADELRQKRARSAS